MIKISRPPSRAEMKRFLWKVKIAFSNTINLNIIWRISWSTINYLRRNDSATEISHVCFMLKSYPNWLRFKNTLLGVIADIDTFCCLFLVSLLLLLSYMNFFDNLSCIPLFSPILRKKGAKRVKKWAKMGFFGKSRKTGLNFFWKFVKFSK